MQFRKLLANQVGNYSEYNLALLRMPELTLVEKEGGGGSFFIWEAQGGHPVSLFGITAWHFIMLLQNQTK